MSEHSDNSHLITPENYPGGRWVAAEDVHSLKNCWNRSARFLSGYETPFCQSVGINEGPITHWYFAPDDVQKEEPEMSDKDKQETEHAVLVLGICLLGFGFTVICTALAGWIGFGVGCMACGALFVFV